MIGVRGCLGEEGALLKSHFGHSGVTGQVVVSAIRRISYDTPELMEHSLVVANVVRENFVVSSRNGQPLRP